MAYLSATTISATTFYSGATNLSSIITSLSGSSGNLWAAGTGYNSIIQNNGTGNIASVAFSFAQGRSNIASGVGSSILGGLSNSISHTHSGIIAGQYNIINGGGGGHGFIGGGNNNTLTIVNKISPSIIGGSYNSVTRNQASIIGGEGNVVNADKSVIVGGANNFITRSSGSYNSNAFIGGGFFNSATTNYSTVIGGRGNLASALNSSIIAGSGNTISGERSVILGGANINKSGNDTVYVPILNIVNIGSGTPIINLGIDSYGNVVTGTTGGSSTFVQNGFNTYTGGTDNFPTVNISAATLSYLSATSISATTFYSGATNLSSIITSLSGSSGNLWSASTGVNSIIQNNGLGNVASGPNSIVGGNGCSVNVDGSVIFGALNTSITGSIGGARWSSIIGGNQNTINCNTNPNATSIFIGGGTLNTAYGSQQGAIVGGASNYVEGSNSFIGAGTGNRVDGNADNSVILGGASNRHYTESNWSSIVGGQGNYLFGAL